MEEMSKRKQGRRGNGCGNVRLKGNTYFCRFTNARGERQEVSAHTSNYQEALKILATYTEPIRKSQSDEELKLRLRQQIEVLELRKDVAKIERLKLEDLVDKFLNHRNLSDITKGTKKIYRYHLELLIKHLKAKYPNVVNVDDVTMEVADGVMCELTKACTSAVYNLALATYRRAWGMFGISNPFLKIEKRKIDKSRHRANISVDDMRRIFKACRDDKERAVWGMAAYTGLRCGDVCCLTYGAFSEGLRTVTWMPMKTRKHMTNPLVIPICDALKRLLNRVLDWSKIGNEKFKDEPIWADYKGRYKSGIDRWFGRTLKKAGIQSSHIDADGHVAIDTGFHITRHFFITNAPRYMSALLVQKIAGHSSIDMTAHYFHENEEDMVAGLSQMPDLNADGDDDDCAKRSDAEEIMRMLDGMREKDESALDCLKRLVAMSSQCKVA